MNEYFSLEFQNFGFFFAPETEAAPSFCRLSKMVIFFRKPRGWKSHQNWTPALQGDAHFHVASRVGYRQSSLGNAEHYHPFVPWLEKCAIESPKIEALRVFHATKAFFFLVVLGPRIWWINHGFWLPWFFCGGKKEGEIFVRRVFGGHVYSSDDLRIGFCDGQVQQIWILGRGEVSWLFGILGRSEAGCAADFISKLFQKRSRFFLEKKISYFSVSFKCLAIFDLTGMFGHFFFRRQPVKEVTWRYLRFKNYDTCTAILQPKTQEWHPSYRAVSIIDRFWWCWMFTASWLQ